MTNFEKVVEFHNNFHVRVGTIGHMPSDSRVLLRVRLIQEELAELIEQMQLGNYPNIAKEMADLLYVVYGAAVEYGIPIDEVFKEVHESNMTKDNTRDSGGKIVKGTNYVPADIHKVLDIAVRNKGGL